MRWHVLSSNFLFLRGECQRRQQAIGQHKHRKATDGVTATLGVCDAVFVPEGVLGAELVKILHGKSGFGFEGQVVTTGFAKAMAGGFVTADLQGGVGF